MQIAILADIHMHDLLGGYGTLSGADGQVSLRTFADTFASTRVFNESHPALVAALNDIHARGISHVVLLGDYSDDGQFGAMQALLRQLEPWRERGMHFFATFGNHDVYGPDNRHHAKVLTDASGHSAVTVSSDPKASAVISRDMLGMSKPEAMLALADHAIMGAPDALHWETPFGTAPDLAHRQPAGGDGASLDASYLVEPVSGLWLLMIDANVYAQEDGEWRVRANKAWDHVIAQRPYLLDWVRSVARRAKAGGKTLLTFSHYPAIPLALERCGDEAQSACTPGWNERMPAPAIAQMLAEAGIKLHFSGHMHVAGRIELHGLVNIAIPSIVAYPAGYGVVSVDAGQPMVQFVPLTTVPGSDIAHEAYSRQGADLDLAEGADAARRYDRFLSTHMASLIEGRHLYEDWSEGFRAMLDQPLAFALELTASLRPATLREMVVDYYFLRAGDELAWPDLSPGRQQWYRDFCFWASRRGAGLDEDTAGFVRLFSSLPIFGTALGRAI